jgi:hypothetical protein
LGSAIAPVRTLAGCAPSPLHPAAIQLPSLCAVMLEWYSIPSTFVDLYHLLHAFSLTPKNAHLQRTVAKAIAQPAIFSHFFAWQIN